MESIIKEISKTLWDATSDSMNRWHATGEDEKREWQDTIKKIIAALSLTPEAALALMESKAAIIPTELTDDMCDAIWKENDSENQWRSNESSPVLRSYHRCIIETTPHKNRINNPKNSSITIINSDISHTFEVKKKDMTASNRLIQLRSLLTLAEKAEGPDRELDARIWVVLGRTEDVNQPFKPAGPEIVINGLTMPEAIDKFPKYAAETARTWNVPLITASIDAAIELIGQALPGWSWSCRRSGFGSPAQAQVWDPTTAPSECPGYDAEHNSGSPPLALLSALCRALIAMESARDV